MLAVSQEIWRYRSVPVGSDGGCFSLLEKRLLDRDKEKKTVWVQVLMQYEQCAFDLARPLEGAVIPPAEPRAVCVCVCVCECVYVCVPVIV